jgi:hypothetical protein
VGGELRPARLGWVVGLLCLLVPVASAGATTFTPTRFDDPLAGGTACAAPPFDCSLRGAVAAAADGDTIRLAKGTYTLTQGELQLANTITLIGAGPTVTTIKQTAADRVIQALGGLTAQGLTITGGKLVGGPGADGAMPGAPGADGTDISGGGIDASGALTLTDVIVTGNHVTGGAGGNGAAGSGGPGGAGGAGGVADGAGISGGSPVTLTRVSITDNVATGGAPGNGGSSDGTGSPGGKGGSAGEAGGAGISLGTSSTLDASDSLIADNHAISTAGGKGGPGGVITGLPGAGGQGEPGEGGGLFSNGIVDLTNVTIAGNSASGSDGGPGGDARSNNFATNGGAGGIAFGGGGGAIALFNGAAGHFASVTIAGNSAGHGTGGPGGAGADGGATGQAGQSVQSSGGNLDLQSATATVRGSIIALGAGDPGTENCTINSGSLTSLGHNLEDKNQCFATAGPADQTSTPAGLGPLANNGGPTETLALTAGSAAIHAGETHCVSALGTALADDQRGRPRHSPCDIGAFEGQPPSISGAPSILGSALGGRTLICRVQTVAGDGPVVSRITWLRNGAAIPGAGGATHAIGATDAGSALACQVQLSNPFGSSATVTSPPVKVMAATLSRLKAKRGRHHHVAISFSLNALTLVRFSVLKCMRARYKTCTKHVRGAPRARVAGPGVIKLSWRPRLHTGRYLLVMTPYAGVSRRVRLAIARR